MTEPSNDNAAKNCRISLKVSFTGKAPAGKSMPITPYLESHRFDPETKRVMGIAFEMARVALRLSDRTDVASEIIATRIIQLANAGERDADLLCEGALTFLREQQGQGGNQPVPPLPEAIDPLRSGTSAVHMGDPP